MRLHFAAVIALVSFLLAPAAIAQLPSRSDTTSTPVPGAGHDYIHSIAETVNPANGSVSIRIPVPIPPGRHLTVPFSFAYDSNGVNYVAHPHDPGTLEWFTTNADNNVPTNGFSQTGWTETVPTMSDYIIHWTTTPDGGHLIQCYATVNFVFQDPMGNRHDLDLSNYSDPGGIGPCTVDDTDWPAGFEGQIALQGGEGSLLATIPSSWTTGPSITATDADGTVYASSGYPASRIWPVYSVTDRYGNSVGINATSYPAFSYTDTLDRPLLQDSGFAVTPETLNVSGLAAHYTINWETLATPNFSTPFKVLSNNGGSGCGNLSHFAWNSYNDHAVSSIQLPNGKSFSFSYDSSYGLVNQMNYPSGGYVRYMWGMNTQAQEIYSVTSNGQSIFVCDFLYAVPAVSDRYVSFDGTKEVLHQSFTYSTNWIPGTDTWQTKTTTVTTYDLVRNTSFQTVYTYSPAQADVPPNSDAGLPAQIPVESNVKYYADLGVTLLKTDSKTWQNERLLKTVETTFPNGQASEIAFNYDANEMEIEHDDYDFGTTLPPSPPGPLLRKTVTSYSPFTGYHIVDKPASVIVYDGSSNKAGETDYTYDSPAGSATSGVVGFSAWCNCGSLTKEARWLNTSGTYINTTFTNDNTGQRLSMLDPNGNSTAYSYSDSYTSGTPPGNTNAYLTQVTMPQTNGVNHIENFSYAYADGELTQSKDQNSQFTTYTYNTPPTGCNLPDGLDRLSEIDYPDGGKTTYCYNDASYNSSTPSPSVTTTKEITSSTNLIALSAMDGLGHVLTSRLTSDSDGTDYTATIYDGLARAYKSYNPTRCNPPTTNCGESTWGQTTNYYDALGRTTIVVPPDGTIPTGSSCPSNDVCTSYSGNTTTVTDEAGHSRESFTDGLGRLSQVIENPGGLGYVTSYTYDALNNLTNVVQNGSRPRTFAYDSLAQLTSSTNPESSYSSSNGTTVPTTYVYDADGNLTSKTMPAQNQTGTTTVTLSYCYDALNRLTSKAYTNQSCPMGSPIASYSYDQTTSNGLTVTNGIGRSTGMTDAAGNEAWSYDVMGRVLKDQRTLNSITKSTTYVYLPYVDGSINTITYPSGRVFAYTTGLADRLTSVVDSSVNYATAAHYTPGGALAGILNGTNLSSTFLYNSRLQPCWIYATTGTAMSTNTSCTATDPGPANILDLQYNFALGTADNGNVLGITNNRDTTRSQAFTYDALNRILTAETTSTHATSPTHCWGESYQYDNQTTGGAWGNLTNINVASSAYNGCAHAESLSVTASAQNQISGNGYDTAGNAISYGTASYTYNAENQLTQAAATSTAGYVYDGDGKRVEKTSGGTPYKLYWYGAGGDVLDETDQTGVFTNSNFSEYVFFGGKRIARRDSASHVYYYAADHLGTAREIVLAGQTSSCYDADFYPFGGERAYLMSCAQNYKFTGKERDTESGNDYFGARYYASSMGRFLSPDWAAKIEPVPYAKLDDPQSLNLYSYVRNNPLSRVDKDGHCSSPKVGQGQVGICVDLYIQAKTINVVGQGDGRGPAPNDPKATYRVELQLVADPKNGTISLVKDDAGVSKALGGLISNKGTDSTSPITPTTDKDGTTHFTINNTALNGLHDLPGAPKDTIKTTLNMDVTSEGKVGVEGGMRTAYPSLEIYSYNPSGQSTTILQMTEHNPSDLANQNQPVPQVAPQ